MSQRLGICHIVEIRKFLLGHVGHLHQWIFEIRKLVAHCHVVESRQVIELESVTYLLNIHGRVVRVLRFIEEILASEIACIIHIDSGCQKPCGKPSPHLVLNEEV